MNEYEQQRVRVQGSLGSNSQTLSPCPSLLEHLEIREWTEIIGLDLNYRSYLDPAMERMVCCIAISVQFVLFVHVIWIKWAERGYRSSSILAFLAPLGVECKDVGSVYVGWFSTETLSGASGVSSVLEGPLQQVPRVDYRCWITTKAINTIMWLWCKGSVYLNLKSIPLRHRGFKREKRECSKGNFEQTFSFFPKFLSHIQLLPFKSRFN